MASGYQTALCRYGRLKSFDNAAITIAGIVLMAMRQPKPPEHGENRTNGDELGRQQLHRGLSRRLPFRHSNVELEADRFALDALAQLPDELRHGYSEGTLFAVRAGRCLIGDEMGLGKTIQSSARQSSGSRFMGTSVQRPQHSWQDSALPCSRH